MAGEETRPRIGQREVEVEDDSLVRDDTRASLSYKLKRSLEMLARDVLTTDPFVTTDLALLPLEEVVTRSDILILCTPHSVYARADLKGKPVVDVWGFLKNANVVY